MSAINKEEYRSTRTDVEASQFMMPLLSLGLSNTSMTDNILVHFLNKLQESQQRAVMLQNLNHEDAMLMMSPFYDQDEGQGAKPQSKGPIERDIYQTGMELDVSCNFLG